MAKRSKDQAITGEVIDVKPENPELAMALSEGSTIAAFVVGLREFFRRADDLEIAAKSQLEAAKLLKMPTSREEDDTMQEVVRSATYGIKEIGEHWTITSALSKFHKRMTARRDRGVEMLEEVKAIGNGFHTRYKAEAERKAREESDRLRREEETRQRAERDRETAALEAQALAAEESSPTISDREMRFLAELSRTGGRGTEAARFAGYKDPIVQAARLLSSEKIQSVLKARDNAETLRKQATAVKQAPIEVTTPTVKAAVSKGGDRTTWGAEALDPQALIDAVCEGRHGIPRDVLMVNPAKLNEYGKSLHELIDRWPGVRHVKKTGVV